MYTLIGIVVTNIIGSDAVHLSGMKTIGEKCNFDALPVISFFMLDTSIVPTIILGILAMCLVPNMLQSEKLIDLECTDWYSSVAAASVTQTEDPLRLRLLSDEEMMCTLTTRMKRLMMKGGRKT